MKIHRYKCATQQKFNSVTQAWLHKNMPGVLKIFVAKKLVLGCFYLLFSLSLFAQHIITPPFYEDIQKFKKQDSIQKPFANAILFVGSSSFTKWTDVQQYFPAKTIINRGFGGSTLPDVIRYTGDIILPYQAKQIVVYCGDNDLASSDTVTPTIVLKRFKTLFNKIRENDKKVWITFVSIKPSPSRIKLIDKMIETNRLIKSFLNGQRNTSFIDVFNPMLQQGRPDPTLFVSDSLHMNKKGYAIWQKRIQPYLK